MPALRLLLLLSWSFAAAGALLPVVGTDSHAAAEQGHEAPDSPAQEAPCDACDSAEETDAKHLTAAPFLPQPAATLAGFEASSAVPLGSRQPPPPPPPPNA